LVRQTCHLSHFKTFFSTNSQQTNQDCRHVLKISKVQFSENVRKILIEKRKKCEKRVSLCTIPSFLQCGFMPRIAKRKQRNTQSEHRKKMEREKEAKKKQMRQQLPPKGKKR
jgi:hypothetical protein